MNNETLRREYFVYKGVMYGIGTKVLLSDIGCKKHYVSEKNKNKPHTFRFGSNDGWYIFNWIDEGGARYGRSNVTIYDLNEDIKEIIEPVYVKFVPWQEKALENMINKKVSSDIFGGALLYTIIMIIGAIFIDRWLIWIFATAIFIIWLLNQYRT